MIWDNICSNDYNTDSEPNESEIQILMSECSILLSDTQSTLHWALTLDIDSYRGLVSVNGFNTDPLLHFLR